MKEKNILINIENIINILCFMMFKLLFTLDELLLFPKITIFDLLPARRTNKEEMCLINLLFALLESQALCSQPHFLTLIGLSVLPGIKYLFYLVFTIASWSSSCS